jgi:hypothetical protein
LTTLANLYLVVHGGWLRWMTPEGVVLPTPDERAEQEHQRAEQEHQRAEQAEWLLETYKERFGKLE